MAHPEPGRCPNQKWMRTLTTQESPDFSHGECQWLKTNDPIILDLLLNVPPFFNCDFLIADVVKDSNAIKELSNILKAKGLKLEVDAQKNRVILNVW